MREFVKKISNYSKAKKEQFIVIQQNAEDILPSEEEKRNEYLEVIDGIGREDVNYGYDKDNKETCLLYTSLQFMFMMMQLVRSVT